MSQIDIVELAAQAEQTISMRDTSHYVPLQGFDYILANSKLPLILEPNMPLTVIGHGASGVGKDTALMGARDQGTLVRIQTATTRTRRVERNEPFAAYEWLRDTMPQLAGESDAVYFLRLKQSPRFLEADIHYGNLYGTTVEAVAGALTAQNQHSTLPAHPLPVLITEMEGAQTVARNIHGQGNLSNVLILGIERKISEVFKAIAEERQGQDVEARLKRVVEEVLVGRTISHFILRNDTTPGGLERVRLELEKLFAIDHLLQFQK